MKLRQRTWDVICWIAIVLFAIRIVCVLLEVPGLGTWGIMQRGDR